VRRSSQNIDDLHQRAGSREAIEFHGTAAAGLPECGRHAAKPARTDCSASALFRCSGL
jgi:NAD-dependent SIR2 family protein deacetylase